MIKETELTQSDLDQFTGTEQYYRHTFGGKYTDGVRYLAKTAGAYWLIDAIFSHQCTPKIMAVPFQVWKLQKYAWKDYQWVLTMREDKDAPRLVTQWIEYSDFPLDSVELWLIDGILILPSEY